MTQSVPCQRNSARRVRRRAPFTGGGPWRVVLTNWKPQAPAVGGAMLRVVRRYVENGKQAV